MRVAVTVWDKRIAPVFDSSHTLLIVDIKNQEIKNISYKPFNPELAAHLTEDLNHLDIEVFICGAISQAHSTLIEACTIKLIPFIRGNANKVLESYARGNPIIPAFLMPGCGKGSSLV